MYKNTDTIAISVVAVLVIAKLILPAVLEVSKIASTLQNVLAM